MGTRGLMGFRIDGVDRASYNHFDSYPEGLGADMLQFIADSALHERASRDLFAGLVRAMVPVTGAPTREQQKELAEFTDLSVNAGRMDSFYCCLRKTQGDPGAMLRAKYFEDGSTFIRDGLFCEHAYIINFDTGKLEYYRGFVKHGLPIATVIKDPGRYWALGPDEDGSEKYGACVLATQIPFKRILPDTVAERVKSLERASAKISRLCDRLEASQGADA